MAVILFILLEIFIGVAAVFMSLLWSWEWFGDIWHQNFLSSPITPFILLLTINIVCIWLSPRYIGGLRIYRWHYAITIAAYGFGAYLSVQYLGST